MISTGGLVGNLTLGLGHERAVDLDDSVLWSRARSGDSDAFGMLFERHERTIYNYCFRRVGSWAVADDLVSIVFLEAWRRVDPALLRLMQKGNRVIRWSEPTPIATGLAAGSRPLSGRLRVPSPGLRLASLLGAVASSKGWMNPLFRGDSG